MSKNTKIPASDDLSILECTDAIFILRYLDRNPGALQADIIASDGNNRRTKLTRLKELSESGLVCTTKDLTKGKAIHYSLTKAGEKTVKRLEQISEVFKKYDIGSTNSKFYNDRSIIISANDVEVAKKQIERETLRNDIKHVYIRSEGDAEELIDELREAFSEVDIDRLKEEKE